MKTTLTVLTVLLLAPLAAISAADAPEPDGKVKPNIVFIFADDWGWGDLSCHGHPFLKTPNLDRLAREGTDFQQFNVLSPVCSPSRAAVMTGHYPARYSVHQHFAQPALNHQRGMPDWLDPNAPTLPRFLKEAGYRTAHFGKWHLTSRLTEGAPKPEAYGYDEFAVFNGGAEWESADLHATAANTAAFIKASKGKPFFINAWIHESHTPHVPTPESMEKWKHLDPQKQVYAAVITDGDNAVGTILDALKAEGLEDNTIVMFSSDNGPEHTAAKDAPHKHKSDPDAQVKRYGTFNSVGETGGMRGRKRSLFEGGVRVPFIVRWPGHTTAGAKNDTTDFSAVDLLPTLCAAAGVTLPADYKGDGENLLAAFNGKAVPRTRPIFWQWLGTKSEPDYWPGLAVRDGDWKLVMTDDAQRVELHHLTHDRAEATDVAKEHPEVVARLTKLALDWKATLPTGVDPSCVSKTRGNEPKKRAKKPADNTKPVEPISTEFKAKLQVTLVKHLNQLLKDDGSITEMKGKTSEGNGALAFYLMFEVTGEQRFRKAALTLAEQVLKDMRATKHGVLPIKEKDKPGGKTIIGGGPPALGAYTSGVAYILHKEGGRNDDLKYIATVLDRYPWSEEGWFASTIDVDTGESKLPMTKPAIINKTAAVAMAAGIVSGYVGEIAPELAASLKRKADKCIYSKIIPAQLEDGFWHYSLLDKDPKDKDVLGYFMLTTKELMDLQKFNPTYREEKLTAAVKKAQAFALKHIAPMTDPNTGTSTSEHATRGTPTHYAIKEDLKRSFQLGLVLIGGGHTEEGIKIMTTALDHFPIGNAGQDGAHAAEPSALILSGF